LALAALARREHSCLELRRKLSAKGFRETVIEGELQRLTDERLQDDGRFAEAYIRYRAGSGYGPVKIRVELKQRGIDEGLAGRSFAQADIDWQERVGTAWQKKFGIVATQFKERAKQSRFLQYRGFTSDQISGLLGLEY